MASRLGTCGARCLPALLTVQGWSTIFGGSDVVRVVAGGVVKSSLTELEDRVNFRDVYSPLIAATESAGYLVTGMPLDSGGDRVVCCGQRRDDGGYTGNSFWFAERDGRWYLGTWGGLLYRVADVETACSIATVWLSVNHTKTVSDVPDEIRTQFGLTLADESEFDSES